MARLAQIRRNIRDIEQAHAILGRAESVLESSIRGHVKDQLEFWRTIPYLAVGASNKKEYPTEWLQHAIQQIWSTKKYWAIDTGGRGERIHIDCFSGEIMHYSFFQEDTKIAGKKEVLALEGKLDLLDARTLLETLEAIGKYPERGPYMVTRSDCHYSSWEEETNDDWRKEQAFKLPEIIKSRGHYNSYTRKRGKRK